MNDENSTQINFKPLQERWQSVWNARLDLATELEQMARELPRQGRKQLQSISNWFRGSAKLEDALQRPDVLAISMPLLKAEPSSTSEHPSIDHAARMGVCSLGRNVSISRRLIRILLYPILVLMGCFVVGVFFSFFVAPQFEDMFAEFGIELPKITLAVFGLAKFIRQWWWAILMMLLLAVIVFWILSRTGTGNRPANLSWLDQRMMSTRNALASWAWHISLLLEVGVPQREALEAAGKATGNSHLQQVSLARAALSDAEDSVIDQPYFDSPKYRLLDTTMQIPPSEEKIAMLQEVAVYYWDRNRSIGDWWIQWLVSAILFLAGAMILLGVLGLFMPLLAIVSGLTGVVG